jgi:hypothetical protein
MLIKLATRSLLTVLLLGSLASAADRDIGILHVPHDYFGGLAK